jgi:hypothetical protein
VYAYSAVSAMPTQSWQASNYWVDVLFSATGIVTPPPAVGQATLTWDASPDPRTIGYRVYWGTAPGTYQQAYGAGVLATSTAYTVGSLVGGRTWYFAVTAVGEGIESAYSAEASKAVAP